MKKYILIILFIFNSTLLFSEIVTMPLQYLNYSISKNISDGNINHAIGTDFLIQRNNFYHNPGFKYVFGDNIVNIQYSFIPTFYKIFHDNKIEYDPRMFPLLGLGVNFSYNINKNIFGISPEININQSVGFFELTLAYRYNINFNYNNSHEIAFTIKIISFWTFMKLASSV